MHVFEITGRSGRSRILIGERLSSLSRYLPPGRVIVITDENLFRLYRSRFPEAEVVVIGCGERVKTMETLSFIYDRLVSLEADRDTFIVGIGGGIVGDITGFAASTYMRGVRFGFVATSLLAQVDATVGGKNGVNFKGFKNMIGVFNQPEFVIADIGLLKTLPKAEIACGLAEIVKHGCILDDDYFRYIEDNIDSVGVLDESVMLELVKGSVSIKASVVNRDEREAGERRILNFGHTFGHALEKVLGLSHGEAVSLGMVFAARLSVDRGMLSGPDFVRLTDLLGRLNLPVSADYDRASVLEAVQKDKKRAGAAIQFVLLSGLGRAVVVPILLPELARWINSLVPY